MGICYGVEAKNILTEHVHERLLEDDMDAHSMRRDPLEGIIDEPFLEGLDTGRRKEDRKREHDESKKERKRSRDKKERKHKDRSRKKEKGEDKKEKPDLKSVEEYLSDRLQMDVHILNFPSNKKKCLVLDIDYTIFDHKSDFDLAHEFKRPYLHEFLKVCNNYYDIVIWSATAMCHIQTKMEKLHLLNNPEFKISVVLSKEFMIPHAFPGKRKVYVQDIKPLPLIWSKFGNVYNASNTIHIDDVVENFALNPQNGLRIDPFRDALQSRQTDKELFYLTQYLSLIGTLPTFEGLDHSRWKDYIINKLFEAQSTYSLPEFMTPPPPSTSLLAHHQNVLTARSGTLRERRKTKEDPPRVPSATRALVDMSVEEARVDEKGWRADRERRKTKEDPPRASSATRGLVDVSVEARVDEKGWRADVNNNSMVVQLS